MALKKLIDNQYIAVYDMNDCKIISFEAPLTAGCDKTVYKIQNCKAPIRKNFEEPDGTQVQIDSDGKQQNCGQELKAQFIRDIPENQDPQAIRLANPFAQDKPKWNIPYNSLEYNQPLDATANEISKEAKNQYNINLRKASNIAGAYLEVADIYQDKINKAATGNLIKGTDNATGGGVLFKCYDFAYQTFLRLFGIKKDTPLFFDYLLKSQIWLSPTIITTEDGEEPFIVPVVTDKGVEYSCAKAHIFINTKDTNIGSVEPAVNLRIDVLIEQAHLTSLFQTHFLALISQNNPVTWDNWVENLVMQAAQHFSGYGPPPEPTRYDSEDGFRVEGGISSTTPGDIYLGYGFAWGTEGQTDNRIGVVDRKIVITINPNNIANDIATVQEKRAKMREFQQKQRNAVKQHLSNRPNIINHPPATSTTDIKLDLTKKINTVAPTRDAITGSGGNTAVNGSIIQINLQKVVRD